MMLEDMKIKLNPLYSRETQDALYKLGFCWAMSNDTEYLDYDVNYVYASKERMLLSYGISSKVFEEHKAREYFYYKLGDKLVSSIPVESKYAVTPSEPFKEITPTMALAHKIIPQRPEATNKEPPIGLRPKMFADKNRIEEILEAMLRYNEADYVIPFKWEDELSDLLHNSRKAQE